VFNGVMDLDAAGPSLSVPAALRKKGKKTRITIKITNMESRHKPELNFLLVASNHGPEAVNQTFLLCTKGSKIAVGSPSINNRIWILTSSCC